MPKVSEKTLRKRRVEQYREVFKNIDDDKMAIVERTIDFAVDLEFRLDNLQKDLDRDGFIEEYCNGKDQYGTKESTASKAYSTAIKNIRTLLSCMPAKIDTTNDDGFEDFITTLKK